MARCRTTIALSVFVAALLAIGCATSSTETVKRGDGLRDYRQMVGDIQKATVASRQSVEAVAAASASAAPGAIARFEESLHQLEVASVMARAHADAMEKRGAAYFEEWETELKVEGAAADAAAKERLTELRGHFETILQGSKQVRQDFRPYLEGLRQLRARCDMAKTNVDEVRPALAKSVGEGKKAEQSMDELLVKVNAALTAVMTGAAPPPLKR